MSGHFCNARGLSPVYMNGTLTAHAYMVCHNWLAHVDDHVWVVHRVDNIEAA